MRGTWLLALAYVVFTPAASADGPKPRYLIKTNAYYSMLGVDFDLPIPLDQPGMIGSFQCVLTKQDNKDGIAGIKLTCAKGAKRSFSIKALCDNSDSGDRDYSYMKLTGAFGTEFGVHLRCRTTDEAQ